MPSRGVSRPPAWAALAKRIHETRACAPIDQGKIGVGGEVTLTTLTREGIEQRVIHRFSRDDFRRVTEGTFHPLGQMGPCICGSGRRYRDCCIAKWVHLPCHCGSGNTLGDCHAIDAAAKVGRNEPCPCGSGAKYKKCCDGALVGG